MFLYNKEMGVKIVFPFLYFYVLKELNIYQIQITSIKFKDRSIINNVFVYQVYLVY